MFGKEEKGKLNRRYAVLAAATIGIAVVFLAIFSVQYVSGTTGFVYTTDTSDNPKTSFDPGETVRVRWFSTTTPFTMTISAPAIAYSNTLTITVSSGSEDFPNLEPAYYTITLTDGTEKTFAVGTFESVPEYALGALAAIGACALAFIIFKKRR